MERQEKIEKIMIKNYLKEIALGIIAEEEFEVYELENGKLALRDLQYANLGDIESEEFNDLGEILDRLDTYHNDYFVNGLIECLYEEYDVDLWKYTDIFNYIVDNDIYKEEWLNMYLLSNPKMLEGVKL